MEAVTVCDGKYTIINNNGILKALRYGEEWKDLTGDNLVYWMLVELLKPKLDEQQSKALLDARDIAMTHTLKARIPECGEFARIAQDLDWLCYQLNIEKE